MRRDAIQYIITHQWADRRLVQALKELAALDELESVREAARGALHEMAAATQH